MIEAQFKDALTSAGLNTREPIIADGTLRRFQVDGDKPRSLNGWYVLFNDTSPSGAFGSWKTGAKYTWHLNGFDTLSQFERERHNQKMKAAQEQRQKQDKLIKDKAAKRANIIWGEANSCLGNHAYLIKKNVKSHGLRVSGDKLVIPMMDIEGNLHSIQTIDEAGNKRFLSGGRKKGCFYALGSPLGALNIAEGYSTAATLYEVTGIPTAVSFDAGNLIHVAKAFRSKFPALGITICADNDTKTPQNIGVMKAKEAALAVGGLVAIPPHHGDFNDFYNGTK